MSVPLAVLGVSYPENVHSIGAWWNVFRAAIERIKQPTDVDIVVQELGTDTPGDIKVFRRYLKPDIAVVTAVSPEHMERFKTIEAVAKEELLVSSFSKHTIVNRDDIDEKYAKYASTHSINTYGMDHKAEYYIILDEAGPLDGKMGQLISPDWPKLSINLQLIGAHNVKAAVAAAAVAARLGLAAEEVAVGLSKITPVAGRMQLLRGANESVIIDDSYNSSPLALKAAIETLQKVSAHKRFAIVGSMNEMGDYSKEAHATSALVCDPSKLEFIVTVGREANDYFAPAAKARGCQVKTFDSPYEAGGFIRGMLVPDSVVLVKGSQNGVFTEEAVKVLLHDMQDEDKLVRQSPAWMAMKEKQFQRPIQSTDD